MKGCRTRYSVMATAQTRGSLSVCSRSQRCHTPKLPTRRTIIAARAHVHMCLQVFAHLVRAPGPTSVGKDAVRMQYGER